MNRVVKDINLNEILFNNSNSTYKKSKEHTLIHSICINCFIIKTCNAMKDQCYTYKTSNCTLSKDSTYL